VEFVAEFVKITHTNFAEVTRVILVEENAVVVHSSGVSSASRVFAVFADSAVAGTYVAALLPVFLEASCHFFWFSLGFRRCDQGGNGVGIVVWNEIKIASLYIYGFWALSRAFCNLIFYCFHFQNFSFSS